MIQKAAVARVRTSDVLLECLNRQIDKCDHYGNAADKISEVTGCLYHIISLSVACAETDSIADPDPQVTPQ